MDRELLNELKEFLAERMVDNMTTEQLAEYVQDDLFTYFDKQGEHDFLQFIAIKGNCNCEFVNHIKYAPQ